MIKHFITDIDGVLTTGHFIYTEDGKFGKIFGPHDKDGLEIIRTLGLTIDFVTADESGFHISQKRIIKDWKFLPSQLHLIRDGDRLEWIKQKYDLEEVAYVGDGIHDAMVLKEVGLGIAPHNARIEAKRAARYITDNIGGSGVILDAALIIQEYNDKEKNSGINFWTI